MENKDIYSLEDVRMRKTEEAIGKIRKTVGRDKEFKKYLERYLNKDKLNDLFNTLWRKKDFKKIQRINRLFNTIYIANFTKSGLRRHEPTLGVYDKIKVTRKCFDKINNIMKEENIEPYNPLWMAH